VLISKNLDLDVARFIDILLNHEIVVAKRFGLAFGERVPKCARKSRG
jgi:hypothetical protein